MPEQPAIMTIAEQAANKAKVDLSWLSTPTYADVLAAAKQVADCHHCPEEEKKSSQQQLELIMFDSQEEILTLRPLIEAAAQQVGICTGSLSDEQKRSFIGTAALQAAENKARQEKSLALIKTTMLATQRNRVAGAV